jgi:EAL domain-containing protein (putative c-di-GMP-specific phosphodiesterase class I)
LAFTRRQMRDRLGEALARRELELHYQPKVNLRVGKVIAAEALLRWRHPERGLIPPAEFLPLVEHDDLIIDIGEWVIRAALAQMAEWRAAGLDLPVSVNVAARQLQHADFVDCLHGCLAEYPDLPDGSLELEILESAALDNIAHVREIINTCQRMGVGFALDDFGTGYASLTYLRDIPADVLKIDRSFVRDVLEDADDLILIDGVIGLATAFRRTVVAEGVESAEQGVLLMRLGCDIAQGYGIARPMPAADIPAWVAGYRPDPQWALWADTGWEMVDFPLLVARYDHVRWVRQLVEYVEGAPPAPWRARTDRPPPVPLRPLVLRPGSSTLWRTGGIRRPGAGPHRRPRARPRDRAAVRGRADGTGQGRHPPSAGAQGAHPGRPGRPAAGGRIGPTGANPRPGPIAPSHGRRAA